MFFNSTVVFAETTSLTESIKNQRLTANRKIYAKVDGDENFQLVHQDRANLTYDEKVSIENNQRKFTLDKEVSSEWPNYTMPKKEGYTAYLTDETGQKEEKLADGIIPKSEVTITSLDNTNLDRNYYIIYYPDERTLSVEYIDKTTNEILSKDSYSGKSGEKISLNITNPDKNKYSIDNNIIPSSYTFTGDSNQQVKIYLKDKNSNSKKEEEKRNKITSPNINLKENPKTNGSLPDTYLNDDDKAISLYTMPNRKKAVMKNKKNKMNSSFKKAELNFNQWSLIVLGTVIIISSFFICKIKLKSEV
nr:hypothetical protein [Lactobacillus mulieris]